MCLTTQAGSSRNQHRTPCFFNSVVGLPYYVRHALTQPPDRTTPIGQQINAYLTSQSALPDQAIHLLFSANRWEAQPAIAALLASGTSVLADRYYHSGIVYSAAKGNPELGLRWARAPEAGLPRPDLVVFLDLDEREAARRGGFGDEKYEVPEMQRRVRDLFHGLGAGRVGDVRLAQEAEDLRIVDASPSVEEVAEEIWKAVRPRVEAVERGEVGREVRKVV